MIQAGLVAPNAGIDFIGSIFGRLDHELRIRQKRAGHGNHVRIAPGQHLFGNLGGVDAVAGDQRDGNAAF